MEVKELRVHSRFLERCKYSYSSGAMRSRILNNLLYKNAVKFVDRPRTSLVHNIDNLYAELNKDFFRQMRLDPEKGKLYKYF